MYGALYPWVQGKLLGSFGLNNVSGRAVSIVSALFLVDLACLSVMRTGEKWWYLAISWAIILGVNHRSEQYFADSRPDMTALLVLAAALCILGYGCERRRGWAVVLGTVLLVSGFWFKQIVAVFSIVPLLVLLAQALAEPAGVDLRRHSAGGDGLHDRRAEVRQPGGLPLHGRDTGAATPSTGLGPPSFFGSSCWTRRCFSWCSANGWFRSSDRERATPHSLAAGGACGGASVQRGGSSEGRRLGQQSAAGAPGDGCVCGATAAQDLGASGQCEYADSGAPRLRCLSGLCALDDDLSSPYLREQRPGRRVPAGSRVLAGGDDHARTASARSFAPRTRRFPSMRSGMPAGISTQSETPVRRAGPGRTGYPTRYSPRLRRPTTSSTSRTTQSTSMKSVWKSWDSSSIPRSRASSITTKSGGEADRIDR